MRGGISMQLGWAEQEIQRLFIEFSQMSSMIAPLRRQLAHITNTSGLLSRLMCCGLSHTRHLPSCLGVSFLATNTDSVSLSDEDTDDDEEFESCFWEQTPYENIVKMCRYKIFLTESSSSEPESLSPSLLSDESLLLSALFVVPGVRRFLEYSRSLRSNSMGSASDVLIG